MLTDPGGEVLRANPAACRSYRCTEADIRRLGRAHLVVEDDAALRFLDARRRDGIARGVLTFRRFDGSPFPAEVTSVLARSRDGQTLTYVIFRDLSSASEAERELAETRTQAELALRRSERRYRDLVEMSPDAVFVNRGGRVDFVNPAALTLFGATDPAQLLGKSPFELFAPECHALIRERLEVLAAGQWVPQVEEVILRFDGTRRAVDVSAAPFVDATGVAFQAVLRDATARKEAQRALEARERRFRSLVEDSHDLTLVLDAGARITYAAPEAARVLGLDARRAERPCLFDLASPEDREAGPVWLAAVAARPGATARRLFRLGGPERWRTFDLVARNQLDDPAVGGVVINGREVTRELLLLEQFQQSQKLESVGRLAGGVSHDFNNLLTVILSCAQGVRAALSAGRSPDPSDAEEILAAGHRAAELTQRLLTFARKQVIAPRTLDLHRALRGARSILQRLVGEDVAVAQALAATRATVRWDPVQLEQVLLNLAVNARDAMPAGGTLSLETRDLAPGDPLRPDGPADGAWVCLTIRDSGHGMTDEVRAHLFEPFFTTKPQGAGTGLGLATVYGIVKQNGAEIAVDSAPGRGTAFHLLVPVVEPDASADARREAALPGGTEAVLLVEDDPSVRRVTARALEAAGYRVTAVDGGPAALAAVGGGLRPDLVVTDVVMPGMDGRAAAEAMRRACPDLRTLFVSGYSRDALSRHGEIGELDAGVELLAKPFTAEALLTRVRAVLDRD